MKMTKAEKLTERFNNCLILMDEIQMDYGKITDVTVNSRAKTRWGQCKAKRVGWNAIGDPVYTFSINISDVLLEDGVPVEALQNTIIHEILHTCPDCQNHGEEWKRRAAIVKQKLGYDIKRCESVREKGIPEAIIQRTDDAKYIVKCKGCGRLVKKNRMCSIVRNPSLWNCGYCHNSFERIL